MKCEDCKFFENSEDTDNINVPECAGQCLRYPPTLEGEYCIENYVFPMTFLDNWCGEFQPKESSLTKDDLFLYDIPNYLRNRLVENGITTVTQLMNNFGKVKSGEIKGIGELGKICIGRLVNDYFERNK